MTPEELLKFRVEELSARFYSMRDAEWKTSLQTFTGYLVIAIGDTQAHLVKIETVHVKWIAVSLVAAIFGVGLYLALRIQDRLHEWNRLKILYLGQLHRMVGLEEAPVRNLLHAKWYAFGAYLCFSAVAAIGCAAYVIVLG